MSTETPTRIRRDDVYNSLKTALDMLAMVAKLSPIPQFDGLISAVKSIMDTVEVRQCLTMLRPWVLV
jgi:hypothetical protein